MSFQIFFESFVADKNILLCLHRLALYPELQAYQIAQKLILLGTNVKAIDRDGKTALMYAVERRNDALMIEHVTRRSDNEMTTRNILSITLMLLVWNMLPCSKKNFWNIYINNKWIQKNDLLLSLAFAPLIHWFGPILWSLIRRKLFSLDILKIVSSPN